MNSKKKRDPLLRLADGTVDTEEIRARSHLFPDDPGSEVIRALLDEMDAMYAEKELKITQEELKSAQEETKKEIAKVEEEKIAAKQLQTNIDRESDAHYLTAGIVVDLKIAVKQITQELKTAQERLKETQERLEETQNQKQQFMSFSDPRRTKPGRVIDAQEKLIQEKNAEIKQLKELLELARGVLIREIVK